MSSLSHALEWEKHKYRAKQHVTRLYLTGTNSATQPWRLPPLPRELRPLVSEHQYFELAELFIKATAWSSMELLAHSVLVVLLPPLSLHFVNHRRYLHWRKAHELVYRSAAEGRLWRSLQTRVWEGHRLELGACSEYALGWIDIFLATAAPLVHQPVPKPPRMSLERITTRGRRSTTGSAAAAAAPSPLLTSSEGASAAVSPLISPLGSAPKEFGVPATSSPLVVPARKTPPPQLMMRAASPPARRRRRRRRRPRQRTTPRRRRRRPRRRRLSMPPRPPSSRRRAAPGGGGGLLNGGFSPVISRTLPPEPASPPAPAVPRGPSPFGAPAGADMGPTPQNAGARSARQRRPAARRRRGEGHAAGAVHDARGVALGRAVAFGRVLLRCRAAAAAAAAVASAPRSPAPTAAVQDARISHRIWLCGDATFVSPLNIDASDFLAYAGLSTALAEGTAAAAALNAKLRRVDRFVVVAAAPR